MSWVPLFIFTKVSRVGKPFPSWNFALCLKYPEYPSSVYELSVQIAVDGSPKDSVFLAYIDYCAFYFLSEL